MSKERHRRRPLNLTIAILLIALIILSPFVGTKVSYAASESCNYTIKVYNLHTGSVMTDTWTDQGSVASAYIVMPWAQDGAQSVYAGDNVYSSKDMTEYDADWNFNTGWRPGHPNHLEYVFVGWKVVPAGKTFDEVTDYASTEAYLFKFTPNEGDTLYAVWDKGSLPEKATVEVLILDEDTKNPVEGVTIKLEDIPMSPSDVDGYARSLEPATIPWSSWDYLRLNGGYTYQIADVPDGYFADKAVSYYYIGPSRFYGSNYAGQYPALEESSDGMILNGIYEGNSVNKEGSQKSNRFVRFIAYVKKNDSGGVRITKQDSKDSSRKLSGAKFEVKAEIVPTDLYEALRDIYALPGDYALYAEEFDPSSVIGNPDDVQWVIDNFETKFKPKNLFYNYDKIYADIFGNDSIIVNGTKHQSGDTVMTITTDSQGIAETGITLPSLSALGQKVKYTIVETEPPKGYAIDKPEVASDVELTKGDYLEYTVTDTKEEKFFDVEISKVETGGSTELPGATLTITSAEVEGFETLEWTSGDETKKVSLAPGTYTLTETTAPDGYLKAESIEFRVTEDGRVEVKGEDGSYTEAKDAKVTMEDDWTKVTISKTDIAGSKEIGGAKLQVLDKDGNVVEEWTSVEGKSHPIEKKLIAGETYTLKEITAPDGYEIAEEIAFQVEEDGTVTIGGEAQKDNKVVMKDEKTPEKGDEPKEEEKPKEENKPKEESKPKEENKPKGKETLKPEKTKSPKTGDEADMIRFLLLLLASGGVLAAMALRRRRT